MTRRPFEKPLQLTLGPSAYAALSRALLTTGRVRVTIDCPGEAVAATFEVRATDAGGLMRPTSATIAQLETFMPVKVTT